MPKKKVKKKTKKTTKSKTIKKKTAKRKTPARKKKAQKKASLPFDNLVDWGSIGKTLKNFSPNDLVKFATKQRKTVEKEVKRLAGEIIETLNEADFLSQKDRLVKDAQKSLSGLVNKVGKSGFISKTAGDFVDAFDLPTKKDVGKLTSRLSQLEKRLSGLSKTKRKKSASRARAR